MLGSYRCNLGLKELLVLLALHASVAAAQSDSATGDQPKQDGAEPTRVEKTHRLVERKVNEASQWFDSFFDDQNYLEEDASTRLRLRPELYLQKKEAAKVRVKLAAKVNLPKLSKKASLVIGGDDGAGDFENSFDDTLDDPTVGMQFFGKQSRTWNTSITAGIKLKRGLALFAGPRVRYLQDLGERSQFRIVQTVRWFTDNGWDTRTRLDFDYVFKSGVFLRQTIDGRWRADRHEEEGFRTRVSTSVTQPLKRYNAGLQYEWFTIFHTEPNNKVDSTTLALRFRKRSKQQDWLFYEVVPQIAFEDEFDWEINPGIRLRIEIIFGKDNRKGKTRKNDDFLW